MEPGCLLVACKRIAHRAGESRLGCPGGRPLRARSRRNTPRQVLSRISTIEGDAWSQFSLFPYSVHGTRVVCQEDQPDGEPMNPPPVMSISEVGPSRRQVPPPCGGGVRTGMHPRPLQPAAERLGGQCLCRPLVRGWAGAYPTITDAGGHYLSRGRSHSGADERDVPRPEAHLLWEGGRRFEPLVPQPLKWQASGGV